MKKSFYNIFRLYWCDCSRSSYMLLVSIVIINLFTVTMVFYWNQWLGQFFNALQNYNLSEFYILLGKFSFIIIIIVSCLNTEFYLRAKLEIRWREWLTRYYLKKWLFSKVYYKSNFITHDDNAEQKISDDIREFVSTSIRLVFDGLTAIATILVFIKLLWDLSGIIKFNLLGITITIYGYLVWAVIIYAILGSLTVAYSGKSLSRVTQEKRSKEADFRFGVVRVKEYNESIALYNGEKLEYDTLINLFKFIKLNFIQTLNIQLRMRIIRSAYNQVGSIFPLLIAAPRFFAHQIMLGGLMQIRAAFDEIKESLFYFINSFDDFSLLHAILGRISEFDLMICKANNLVTIPKTISSDNPMEVLKLENLQVSLPNNQLIVSALTLSLNRGDKLFIDGVSGVGKTVLLKTIAGIWPFASGIIYRANNTTELSISQKPYLPLGNLKEIICYPSIHRVEDSTVITIMKLCKVSHLINQLYVIDRWDKVLSLGEQQRIAICRVLINKPDILFLDEATSALDLVTEEELYKLINNTLINSIIISVAHKPQVKSWHNKYLLIKSDKSSN